MSTLTKKCSKCGEVKELLEFNKDKSRKDGYRYYCKKCGSEYSQRWAKNNPEKNRENAQLWKKNNPEKVKKCIQQWKKNNPEKIREINRRWYKNNPKKAQQWRKDNPERNKKNYQQWRKNNPEKVRKINKRWRKNNPEKNKENILQWRKNNPERVRELSKKNSQRWRENNPERHREQVQRWQKNNPEKLKKSQQKRDKKRRATPKGVLDIRMSGAIRHSLKGNKNGRSWEKLVGYTKDDLKIHLENLFTPEMNWEEFLKGRIHIDHDIPKKLFHYKKSEDPEFQECWALKNLQPLWDKDNLSKGSKLDYEYTTKN